MSDSQGWVKIHRSLLDWEWFQDAKTLQLFLYLILKANHAPKKWQGIDIARGELITSLDSLVAGTKISRQSIRTSLDRLKSTGEITHQPTRQFSRITIVNYDTYQTTEDQANTLANTLDNTRPTHDQHTTNTRVTLNKNDKNYKNDKNDQEAGEGVAIVPTGTHPPATQKRDPKVLWPKYPAVLLTEAEKPKLVAAYQAKGLDKHDLEDGFRVLQSYSENGNAKKFKNYKNHYLVMIGWVLQEVLARKKKQAHLSRSQNQPKTFQQIADLEFLQTLENRKGAL